MSRVTLRGDWTAVARSGRRPGAGLALAAVILLMGAGCSGEQSALAPAGAQADRVASLFWVMAAAAVLIWLVVMGIAVYAARIQPEPHSERLAKRLLIFGGIAFPTVTLTVLLAYGLSLMPGFRAPGDGLEIHVSGEQWWWRVAYDRGDGSAAVPLANEIRLPVGQRVEVALSSPDVIHSFWIPPIAGKVDMIPGRTTRLALEPTETGEFRGVCAEYCGTSHALMAFKVVVMEEDAFAEWLAHQAAPAAEMLDGQAAEGAELFRSVGCGGCHAVRGTPARGVIGPDLTHLASRRSLAAGILPMTAEALHDWIARTHEVKPDARMPSFGALPDDDLDAIVAYLGSLT